MSRLSDKIDKLNDEICSLQDRLDSLESKQYRAGFKKRRKLHRKKLAKDPIYGVICAMSRQLEKDLYGIK
jgi:chromosome segregation ATPase